MNTSTYRRAFTLIELLTVMAIITLLIGILMPSLSGARDMARRTAVQAQLNAMTVGLESFNGDEKKYPPSNACQYTSLKATTIDNEMTYWKVGTTAAPYQGAHLLVDALVGRDMLGYDPKAKMSAADTYDRWAATNGRRAPYIPKDGVDLSSTAKPPEDGFGAVPDNGCNPLPIDPDNRLVRVFVDKFGWPILYYRASPITNQNTPIIQTDATGSGSYTYQGDGVYDGQDNEVFTSYTDASNKHKIKQANIKLPVGDYGTATKPTLDTNDFAEFIRSFRGTTYGNTVATSQYIQWPRPVKSDTFILLSAGKDGIYGTLDDVANFNVLSADR
jgi:prepilin-type N-terminal cleavage/methylation domain-containing protein